MNDPIKNKYTYFQQIVHKFKARRDIPFRRSFFVGYDLSGNTYWEFTIDGNMHRLRRKMEPYKNLLFKADYFATVPPQWLQWLRRTRNVPPTLTELANDQVRQQRMKILGQQAANKWEMEKIRLEEEQQLKLNAELDRAKQESEQYTKRTAQAAEPSTDSTDINNILHKEDPWAKADASKDLDPTQSAFIKPRNSK
jgi:NADH dehydrogenase [ubiquinone] 1 alpha subcomplex assembly factor 2